jgi:thiosulfate/3-mercaptopyruvate sulfurtransferase
VPQSARSAAFYVVLLLFPATLIVLHLPGGSASPRPYGTQKSADPWTFAQTVQPATLAKEVSGPASHRPTIVCVGLRTLYEGAHVPGAVFHGPAIEASGLADLKKWAQPLSRSADIVIYCGCCPLAHCPNIEPAFTALKAMGFRRLRVLLLPHDFAHDWIEAGYPAVKGADSGVLSSNIDTGTRVQRIRVASDIQRGKLIHHVDPKCLADAGRYQGTVVLHAVIAKDGAIEKLQYISGPPLLTKSAIDVVRQWRYRPTLLNGRPVEVDTTIPVLYKCGD